MDEKEEGRGVGTDLEMQRREGGVRGKEGEEVLRRDVEDLLGVSVGVVLGDEEEDMVGDVVDGGGEVERGLVERAVGVDECLCRAEDLFGAGEERRRRTVDQTR